MKAFIELVDAEYEITFSAPQLDFLQRHADILSNFSHCSESDDPVPLSDMQVEDGSSILDAKVRIAMFGGFAVAEVMADRMVVNFERSTNSDELRTCESCVLACERAIRGVYPGLRVDGTEINFVVRIKIDGGKNADQILRDVVGYGNELDFSQFGDVERLDAIDTSIFHEQKGLSSRFHAYSALPDEPHLYVLFQSSYHEMEDGQSLDDRLAQFKSRTKDLQNLFNILLGGIGIDAVALDWKVDEESNHES